MTLAEHIVAMMLEEEPVIIDPRQHPDLYTWKYKQDDGEDVYSTCMNCEADRFKGLRRYSHGTGVSHGICQRHKEAMMQDIRRLNPGKLKAATQSYGAVKNTVQNSTNAG